MIYHLKKTCFKSGLCIVAKVRQSIHSIIQPYIWLILSCLHIARPFEDMSNSWNELILENYEYQLNQSALFSIFIQGQRANPDPDD